MHTGHRTLKLPLPQKEINETTDFSHADINSRELKAALIILGGL